nr:ATP-dependent acyl-CoA ligase [Deltaproteobacteria bacterium]
PGESDIVAAIVLSDGQKIDPARVFAALSSTLEKHAVPSYLQIVDEIPKSASEKNLDRFLRDEFSPEAKNVYLQEDYR